LHDGVVIFSRALLLGRREGREGREGGEGIACRRGEDERARQVLNDATEISLDPLCNFPLVGSSLHSGDLVSTIVSDPPG